MSEPLSPDMEAMLERIAQRVVTSCNDTKAEERADRRSLRSSRQIGWHSVVPMIISGTVLLGGMMSVWISTTNRNAVADVKIQANKDRLDQFSIKLTSIESAASKVSLAADQVDAFRLDLQAFKQEYRQDFDQLKQEVRASKR